MPIPAIRIRSINHRPYNPDGRYILYWMNTCRRTHWSFALEHAVAQAVERGKPLVVLEALRCNYPYANDRLHRFILDGMAANTRALADQPVTYYPYIEPARDAGKGLLVALAHEAVLVITDDFPAFFLPRMIAAAGQHLPIRLEAVDGNGLLPMRAADHAYPTAYAFRRFLQKQLPEHLMCAPQANPMDDMPLPLPVEPAQNVTTRWPHARTLLLAENGPDLTSLPIDHQVPPAPQRGGEPAAKEHLDTFLEERLSHYCELRNHPDLEMTSGLSPYLHFGHISSHAIFSAITSQEEWGPHRLGPKANGKQTGWWGLSANAEAFLDQLITWRELGFNMCCFEPDRYKDFASLPDWARRTLDAHSRDPRPTCYTLEELREARTHDPLWNAAQRQLRREGTIHNYLRMLWAKKILEWTPTPQKALVAMIELNDCYALDGRDPNSYSGIFWCLGRYDRPWGPARPIFGSIRYMSSANTARKVRLKEYLKRYQEI
jgi:deoxyribodipyrimidine photo-lyase